MIVCRYILETLIKTPNEKHLKLTDKPTYVHYTLKIQLGSQKKKNHSHFNNISLQLSLPIKNINPQSTQMIILLTKRKKYQQKT